MKRRLISFVIVANAFVAMSARAAHVYNGLDLRSDKEISLLREDKNVRATVLVFLSAKCPCSHSHIAELKSLAKDYTEFRFLAIHSNLDEPLPMAKSYFIAQDLPFPVIQDNKAALADELRAFKTPHAFIFSPSGEKLFQGGVSNSARCDQADRHFLREALEDLKAKRPVRTPLARALGCVISREETTP